MPWIPELDPTSDSDLVTVVLIPDTQYVVETEAWNTHFQAAANWIVTNRAEYNIQLVLHLGDVTDNGTDTEFNRALIPMETIWNAGIPFAATIGNHDYDDGSPSADHSDTTQWNAHFGTTQYTVRPWWDGDFKDSGKSENFYFRTTVGGRPTLVVVLEFFPRAAVLTWAGGVIEDNPHHDVIVLTHAYLNHDGTRTEDADDWGPDDYSLSDSSNGEEMWAEIKQYPNVVAVFNGHFIDGNVAVLDSEGDEGNTVFQQFTNWQQETEGGEGRIVLLTINPHTGWATRRVYNPADEAFESTYDLTFRLYQDSSGGVSDHGALTGLADDDHIQYLNAARHSSADHSTVGHYEVVVSGSGPPVAVTNEAEDDWVYGFVS